MKRNTLVWTVVVASFLLLLFAAAAPAAAAGEGEINLSISPVDGEAGPGEVQTYGVIVEDPDDGILSYDDVIIDVVDPDVGEVVDFEEQHDDSSSDNEIRDDGGTLYLSAATFGAFENPATEYTIVEFDVAPTGDADGESTDLSYRESAANEVQSFEDEVYTNNELRDGTFTALEAPFFEVNITAIDDEVVEGEEITVDYEVTNTGDITDEQNIVLDIDGDIEDTDLDIELAGGASHAGTLTYTTETGDAPSVDATVSSDDDSETATVSVLEPGEGEIQLRLDPADGFAEPGVTQTYEVVVEDPDDGILSYDDVVVAVNDTTVGEIVAFEEPHADGSLSDSEITGGGERLELSAATEDSLEDPAAAYTIATFDVEATGTAGESTDLIYDESAAQGVLSMSDEEYEVTDTSGATFTVEEPAFFDVTITDVEDEVVEGETVTVDYEVTNTGDVAGTQNITFEVDGVQEGLEADVTIDAGDTFADAFTYDTDGDDVPSIDVTIASEDDSETATVTVLEEAFFAVNITSVEDTVVEGDTITVDYEVENTGDVSDTQDIFFEVDGDFEDIDQDITLSAGQNHTGTFTYETESGDAPSVNVTVASSDDSETTTVSVLEPGEGEIQLRLDPADGFAEPGATQTYEVVVEDPDDGILSYDDVVVAVSDLSVGEIVAFDEPHADDSLSDSEITGGGERLELSAATEDSLEDPAAAYTIATFDVQATGTGGESMNLSYDESAAQGVLSMSDEEYEVTDTSGATFTVEDPAFYNVTITDVEDEVVEGESVTVDYEVTNTGDVAGTQNITFEVDGLEEDVEPDVALDSGETFIDAFTYETDGDDVPSIDVTVASEDDIDSATVTVLEEAFFAVNITAADDSVVEGDTITVDYEVENTGDVSDTQDIIFEVDGDFEDIEFDVTLAGGETFADSFTYETETGDAPSVNVSVSSSDDAVTETVTVNEPAFFDVTITDLEDAVTAGETVTVDYEIENTGDVQDSQDIIFEVDGIQEDSQDNVDLDSGETFADSFSYDTDEDDVPEIDVTVSSDDDSDTATVSVAEGPFFGVSITNVEDSVTVGETVTVEYEVENFGDETDTQNITFEVDGVQEDSQDNVDLDSAETFADSFAYETDGDDVPEIDVTVASEDDSDTASVTVFEDAFFDVTITDVDDEVTAGETVTVDYRVENIGDESDTQNITFTVDGTEEDVESDVSLSGGSTLASSFDYETDGDDVPEIEVAVASEDDSDNATVTVNEQAFFAVNITSVDDEVVEGETVSVEYEVENIGEESGTQDILFEVDGSFEDIEMDITLAGGETHTGSFTYDTETGDAPSIDVTVSSDDDSVTETVSVLEPGEGEVQLRLDPASGSAEQGQTQTYGVVVEDPDDGILSYDNITISVANTSIGEIVDFEEQHDDSTSDNEIRNAGETLYLSAGTFDAFEDPAAEYTIVEFDVEALGTETATTELTFDDPAGAGVLSMGDEEYAVTDATGAEFTSVESAFFDVTITDVEDEVVEGETVTVEYEVENIGGLADTQNITFEVDGTIEDTETDVSLDSGESATNSFSYETDGDDVPSIEVTVSSEDDVDNATVTVLEDTFFNVTITDVEDAVLVGETVTVDYEVENTGDVTDTQDILFQVDGDFVNLEPDVTLAGGEMVADNFTYDTEADDVPSIDATVSSEDDSDTATVTVNDGAFFDVTITDVDDAVLTGETVTVEYEVNNTGDIADTQNITFDIDGVQEDVEADVTLDSGQTFTNNFTYVTDSDDVPGIDVTVASEDDSDTASVLVDEPAVFNVTITDVEDEVVAGETVTVEYEVENTGTASDTQNITFEVDGVAEDVETDVTLDGGEVFNDAFAYATDDADVPSIDVTVASEDDSDSATVTVLEDASFNVTITDVEDSVLVGETVTVDYEVENTGDVTDTQDILFQVDGDFAGLETDVTLASGETFADSFTYDTEADDVPSIDVTVSSEDDSDTATVTVNDGAFFDVTITDVDDAVLTGETVTVEYEVNNTGDIADTQNITFDVDGVDEDVEVDVTLDSGQTFTDNFTYVTDSDDVPSIDVTVASEDDSDTATVTVDEPAVFNVTITDVEDEVTVGETVTVEYAVENTGTASDIQNITFDVDGVQEDVETDVTLDGGDVFEEAFTYETDADDTPEIDVTVSSEDDSDTATVTVNEPAFFAVNITAVDDEVTEGETITVDYEVENTGDNEDEQLITFEVDSSLVAIEEITLAGGETHQGTFTYETETGDAPSVDVTVASSDDSDTATVSVLEPGEGEVQLRLDPAAGSAEQGQTQTYGVVVEDPDDGILSYHNITISVANTSIGQIVDFEEQHDDSASDNEIRDGGETLYLSASTFDAFEDPADEYTIVEFDVEALGTETATTELTFGDAETAGVLSMDDEEYDVTEATGADFTSVEPAFFDVNITAVDDEVAEGAEITLDYEIENTGDAEATQDIIFDVEGVQEDVEPDVTLDGGETFASQFVYETQEGDAPSVNLTVSSEDDAETTTVTVNEEAIFAVTITDVEDSVLTGETVTVDYEIENTGDLEDTQNITFDVDGVEEEVEPGLTLDGGEVFVSNFTYVTDEDDVPEITVTVSSEDDSADRLVTVDEPAFFDVEITNIDDEVTAGETVTVDYAVENTGTVSDIQNIIFDVDGVEEAVEPDVTLDGGETFTGTFTYETDGDDVPSIDVNVSSTDDFATATVTVNEPAFFAVEITNLDAAVTEGETITVDYEVENTGDVTDTQLITFEVDGELIDIESDVTLSGGETFAGVFTYDTETGDAPSVDVNVSSEDDFDSATVTVNEPAFFDVTITDVEDDVLTGETITVEYEINNTGDVQATQDILFEVDGGFEDIVQDVTLAGGETFADNFTYETDDDDVPSVDLTVLSDDDSDTATVAVNEPAVFDVTITDVEDAVIEGETVTVEYEIENTGDVADTQNITFAVDDVEEDVEPAVTLDGGETFDGTFTYETDADDVPSIEVNVSSEDDFDTATVAVNEPAFFDVTITDVDDEVTEGEEITVEYEIENTGDVSDTQLITFEVDDELIDIVDDLTLDGGETFNSIFTYETETGDAPSVDVNVTSEDDFDTATVTVNEPAFFNVTITDVEESVTAGETITVDYEVENTGDNTDTQSITFEVDGDLEDIESDLTLDGGEIFASNFTYETTTDDAPSVDVTVASSDDSATETVTVDAPAFFDVEITDVEDEVVVGETVTVSYAVENTGGVADTQNITFDVNGTQEDIVEDVTLDGGETFVDTFSYETDEDDVPAIDVTVASEDDTATETVTVNEPAFFNVTITAVEDEVVEGETITVAYEVENTGDVEDTQTISFEVDGNLEGIQQNVNLAGGETYADTFTYQTDGDDIPSVDVLVASADDNDTATVTVLEEALFDVTITDVEDEVVQGETVTVEYEVNNTGEAEGTQNITFEVDGVEEDVEADVTLAGGETFTDAFTYETSGDDIPSIDVTVASDDDSDSATVTVLEEAFFDVTITDVEDEVVEGETVTVEYEVNNTGEAEATQNITFEVDGVQEDVEADVTLAGGETFTDAFTYETSGDDIPSIDVTVASDDDSDSATVTVLEEAFFDVTITDVEDEVVEGETVTVEYEVENTGEAEATQNITFEVDGVEEDVEADITLAGGETFAGTFTYETSGDDIPSIDVTVASDDDSDSATVTVLEEAFFDVTITDVEDEVVEGETVTVEYEVENTGEAEATQNITFEVDGVEEDVEADVTLAGGETFADSFTYETDGDDVPSIDVTVASEDDSDSATVTVLEEAVFDVTITDVEDEVVEGETVTVEYEVNNTGEAEATQNITFEVDGVEEDIEADVTLAGGETFADSFTYETDGDDVPSIDVTVASEDDSDSATVTVLEEALFDVTITDVEDEVVEGEMVTVEYEVENTGEAEATQNITFEVDGVEEDIEADVTLAGGETFTDAFTYETSGDDIPSIDVTVASEDDSDTATVTVLEEAFFDVTITDVEGEVVEGDTVTVEYEVENTGEAEATQNITFEVDGVEEDVEADVTLAGGETFADAFTYETSGDDIPSIDVTVASEDDSDSATVTVLEEALFDVTITDVEDEVVEGDTVTVEYEVENTGEAEATQNITFEVDGVQEDVEADVTLAGGETFAGTFTYETDGDDIPSIDVTVASEDDSDSATVTVLEAAFFDVTITDVEDEVVEGDTVTVEYEVENTGEAEATQDIIFEVDGDQQAVQTGVTLTGGETFADAFTYETSGDDIPSIDVTVASEDDSDSATVTVLEEALFDVTITDVEGEVVEGDTVTVEYEVENLGDAIATQDITFDVDGVEEGVEADITLDGGDTFADTFTYETSGDDIPSIDVTVASEDDSDSATVTVLEEAFFDVTITDVEDEVIAGEMVTVEYVVENLGEVEATQDITFTVEGVEEDVETGLTLAGGETFTDSFSYETDETDVGEIDVTVSSEDDADTATVDVLPADTETLITDISFVGVPDHNTILQGEDVDVEVTIENIGDFVDDVTVTVTLAGETREQTVDIGIGETETVVFDDLTGTAPVGFHDVQAETHDAEASEELIVSFDITFDGRPALDTTGDQLFNDIRGNEGFDILDIQLLFDFLHTDPVQDHPEFLNFAGIDDDRTSIFDVQGLFHQLQAQEAAN